MFIIGAVPDSLISMKKKTKAKKFSPKEVENVHKKKQTFWSKATGGRMK